MSVSAIVSAYKGSFMYLQARIDNLRAQTKVPEIIVVCQEFSPEHEIVAHDEGIVLKLTYNIPTVYEAWNLGIALATSEFLTNANSDDVLYPWALEYMERKIIESGAALVYGDSDIVKVYDGMPVNRFQWSEGGHAELLERCFVGPMPVWRRSLHEKYGFFDGKMHSAGDYEFWLRLTSSGEKLYHLNRCVGAFLSHADSASMREPLRSIWETAQARDRYKITIQEN